MSIVGKVARLRGSGFVAVVLALAATSAIAAPLTDSSPVLWRPAVGSVGAQGSPVYTMVPVPPAAYVVPDFVVGAPTVFLSDALHPVTPPAQLDGVTETRVWTKPDGTLVFDYKVIANPAITRFIRAASVGGDWTGVNILDAGVYWDAGDYGPPISGGGDPAPEWTDGTPVAISRAPETGAPSWVFRDPALIGTVIGPTDDRSAHIWFATDAKAYTTARIGYLDSGATAESNTLVPVPDPTSLALLSMASGMLLIKRRRQQK